ncbi:unnamed protein product, partial [Aphanomyces euteiches]
MQRVAAVPVGPSVELLPQSTSTLLLSLGGFLYLIFTVTCSVVFLFVLFPTTRNDHWWPGFNTSGTQTFLSDVFNAKLIAGESGEFSLLDLSREKDYSVPTTFIDMRRVSARRLLLLPIPLETAIQVLRRNTFQTNIRTTTPYCWADLDLRWQLAHTAKRQERCLAHDSQNAAVYLETMLRNSYNWLSSQYYLPMRTVIFDDINATVAGQAWLDDLLSMTMIPVEDELALWRLHNLTEWTSQVQNLAHEGFDDAIELVSALGVHQRITITSIADVRRGLSAWTTAWAYAGIWNDLFSCQVFNCSLVRGSPLHPDQLGLTWDKDIVLNYETDSPGSRLIRTYVGQYVSIDIRFVQIPLSLIQFYSSLDQHHISSRKNAESVAVTVDAVPTSWKSDDFVYYGGNLLCPFGEARRFVQQSFGYYDDCGPQDPHTIDLTCHSAAFAIAASNLQHNDIPGVCKACSTDYDICSEAITQAFNEETELPQLGLIDQVTLDVKALNLSIIQMATNVTAGNDILLMQKMIADGDLWSFFGWVTIWEWVDGQREVFVFEGDESSITIVSRPYGYLPLPANRLELPQVACQYIRVLVVYVSLILFSIGLVLIVFGALSRFDIDGSNLLSFNRVVGSVWLGRPLLFLRGMTAILVLSTGSVDFVQINGAATIISSRRSIFEVALLAGESTWVVYVLNDLFLPFTTYLSSLCAPLSSLLAFVITADIELTHPFQMTATISRTCSYKTLMSGIVCTSGVVSVGSVTRAGILVSVQLGCVVVAYAIIRIVNGGLKNPRVPPELTQHVAVPAAADAFFTTARGTTYNLDNVACVMSGIIPAFGFVLDVKLWTLFDAVKSSRASGLVLKRCSLGTKRKLEGVLASPAQKRILRVWSVLGFGYMGLSIGSSYTFLRLTESTMTNDFWWATFDLNNTQAYLSNWFNAQLTTMFNRATVHFNDLERALLVTMQNTTDPNVNCPPAYSSMIQDEVNSLPNVISALRQMKSCDILWIFSAYCFVDFEQTWELANSLARQERCRRQYATNGAVYLDGLFRNNHKLALCWGDAWDIAIFGTLRESNAGIAWMDKTLAAELSVVDEVTFWKEHGISHYSTQWQNFKSLGVIESVDVVNALSVAYPLTLKKSNGTFQLSRQTSYKMYWGLAGDLTSISRNGSTMYHKSLVRQASNFAFQNTTLEIQLMANNSLPTPLTPGLSLLRAMLGPFGSIDMYRVAVPPSLIQLHLNLTQALILPLANSLDAQVDFWPYYASSMVSPQPASWDKVYFWGGDVLCPEQPSPQLEIQVAFSLQGSCGINLNEITMVTPELAIKALVAAGMTYNISEGRSIEETCERATHWEACDHVLKVGNALIEHDIMSRSDVELYFTAAQRIKSAEIDINLFQYISREHNSMISISTPGLFDDLDFEFFGWVMLFEWVQGLREVVSFQGDIGAITLLSTKYGLTVSPADAMEVPLNLALYVHRVVQYFTFVLMCVAVIVVKYIIHSRGYIQGLNLFSFNRVAGLVWLGRPLVFIRGVTAITLLSTASLELRRPHAGLVAFLDAPPTNPIKTIFSAGEATWLAYILNDLFSLVTKQYTTSYSLKSSLLLWAAAATWSFLSPVNHSVEIGRMCSIVSVDSQIVCKSGVVRIGNDDRFVGLILLAIASCILCYAIERAIIRRQVPPSQKATSLFLYAAAKYQFRREQWEFMGVYYLDRASAVLNGILSLSMRGFHYVFDIKTWRLYIYPVEPQHPHEPMHLR